MMKVAVTGIYREPIGQTTYRNDNAATWSNDNGMH